MKLIVYVLLFVVPGFGQQALSNKEIYKNYRLAVVQIIAGNAYGTGFLVSADGLLVTANHVVTLPESGFQQFAPSIRVYVTGYGQLFEAAPLVPFAEETPQMRADRVNFDTAVLRLKSAKSLPYHVELGDWSEVDVGDPITVIASLPDYGQMLVAGTIANKGSRATPLGPQTVEMVLLQAPVRHGFSGSPIFSPSGHVVGIVSIELFGITPGLQQLRQDINESHRYVIPRINNIDIFDSQLRMINEFDQNLVSGMGGAVSSTYARQAIENAQKKK